MFLLILSAFGLLNRPMDCKYTVKGEARDAHRCDGVALCPPAGSRWTDPGGLGSLHLYAKLNRSWFCREEEEREREQER